MISLLIGLVILLIVVLFVIYIIDQLPLPENIKLIAKLLVGLLALLEILSHFGAGFHWASL